MLNEVGDVGDYLDSTAQVISTALLNSYFHVYLASRDVVVPGQVNAQISLVVSKVQITFTARPITSASLYLVMESFKRPKQDMFLPRWAHDASEKRGGNLKKSCIPIIQNEALPMIFRVHSPGIDIQVRIYLLR